MEAVHKMNGSTFALWAIVNVILPVLLPIGALALANKFWKNKPQGTDAIYLACKDGQLLWLLMAFCPTALYETCEAWPTHMTWVFLGLVLSFCWLIAVSLFVLGMWTVGILTGKISKDVSGQLTTLHQEGAMIRASKWLLALTAALFLLTKWVLVFRPEVLNWGAF